MDITEYSILCSIIIFRPSWIIHLCVQLCLFSLSAAMIVSPPWVEKCGLSVGTTAAALHWMCHRGVSWGERSRRAYDGGERAERNAFQPHDSPHVNAKPQTWISWLLCTRPLSAAGADWMCSGSGKILHILHSFTWMLQMCVWVFIIVLLFRFFISGGDQGAFVSEKHHFQIVCYLVLCSLTLLNILLQTGWAAPQADSSVQLRPRRARRLGWRWWGWGRGTGCEQTTTSSYTQQSSILYLHLDRICFSLQEPLYKEGKLSFSSAYVTWAENQQRKKNALVKEDVFLNIFCTTDVIQVNSGLLCEVHK